MTSSTMLALGLAESILMASNLNPRDLRVQIVKAVHHCALATLASIEVDSRFEEVTGISLISPSTKFYMQLGVGIGLMFTGWQVSNIRQEQAQQAQE